MLLLELPDECLEEIFKYLELEHQITLKHVCEHFTTTINRLWRRTYKKVNLSSPINEVHYIEKIKMKWLDFMTIVNYRRDDLENSRFKEAYFRQPSKQMEYLDFMSDICDTVQELNADECVGECLHAKHCLPFKAGEERIPLDILACLRNHNFSQLTFINYTVDYDLSAIIDFGKVFPALKRLDILWHPNYRTTPLLNESLKTLVQCEAFEELQIKGSYRPSEVNTVGLIIKQLPSIRSIVLEGNSILNIVTESSSLAHRVYVLPLISLVSETINLLLLQLRYVKKLSLVEYSEHRSQALERLVEGLPNLEELEYSVDDTGSNYGTFVKRLNKLELAIRQQEASKRRTVILNIKFYFGSNGSAFGLDLDQTFFMTNLLRIYYLKKEVKPFRQFLKLYPSGTKET